MEKFLYRGMLFVLFCTAGISVQAGTKTLDKAVDSRVQAQEELVKSQQKINTLTDETRDMVQEYRAAIRKSDSLQTYNTQLAKLVKEQNTSLGAIQRQLDNAEETQRSIVPLMLKMIETLEKFVNLDMPFLLSERQQRVAALKDMMDRPEVSLPDKYRRIMESYQIEMEYGRTIESYKETVEVNGQDYTVDLLRVGRLLMAFQTLDGEISGSWNKTTKRWEILPDSYNRHIRSGLKIAQKQAPPDLIQLPVQVKE